MAGEKIDKLNDKYFTTEEVAREFGYKDAKSLKTSRANKDMVKGINFVVDKVEKSNKIK